MTPHINAEKKDIAKIVLMPGDPLRAKWIAQNFLKDVKQVNDVRGMLAFTGKFKNKLVTVMGHGMGIPSIGIYSYELFKFYEVDYIIRIGSTGSYVPELKIGEVVLVSEAYSDSIYAKKLGVETNFNCLVAQNENLNNLIIQTAEELNKKIMIGRCYSSDVFYSNESYEDIQSNTNAICVEMEAFGLFANAKLLKKQAAVILTCSDSLVTHESLSPSDRQTTFTSMVEIALETILKL